MGGRSSSSRIGGNSTVASAVSTNAVNSRPQIKPSQVDVNDWAYVGAYGRKPRGYGN